MAAAVLSEQVMRLVKDREHEVVDFLTARAEGIMRASGEVFCMNPTHMEGDQPDHHDGEVCLHYSAISQISRALMGRL
jgi:hypothetical protein